MFSYSHSNILQKCHNALLTGRDVVTIDIRILPININKRRNFQYDKPVHVKP